MLWTLLWLLCVATRRGWMNFCRSTRNSQNTRYPRQSRMNATRHDTKAKSRRVRARKGEGSRRGAGRATLDTNRAQVVGTIAEYLVIEILEKKGWEAYQSATAEFDILATKKVGEKSLTIRIEVRTVYADKYGLKFSHSDERVPCDFYVGVRREPQEFYVVPSSKFSSRPAKRWL